MPKWIEFRELEPKLGAKTRQWAVIIKEGEALLGKIGWFGRWRKYCFAANGYGEPIFEETCLRDIAEFCETQTKAHRKKRAEGVP